MYIAADSSATLTGNNDTVNLSGYSGNGDTLTLGSGSYTVGGAYSIVNIAADTAATVTGSHDTVNLDGYSGNGDTLTLGSGAGYVVNGSDTTLTVAADTSTTLTGSNDTMDLDGYSGNGDSITFDGGSGDLFIGSYTTIDASNGLQFTASGSDDTTSLGSRSVMTISSGQSDVIYASGDDIDLTHSGISVEIVGHDDLVSGSHDTVISDGSNDLVVGDYDIATGYGSSDFVDGTGNTDEGTEDPYTGGGYGGGYGYYGIAGKGPALGVPGAHIVAQYDRALGYDAAATAADKAYAEAQQSVGGKLAQSAQDAAGAPAGSRWAGFVVDWAFSGGPSGGPSPVSNSIQSQYQSTVEQAIQDWAKASGLVLQQVADPSQADFAIGWGDFDTAQSGIVGYTSLAASGGLLLPGATVRLEDPGETGLTAAAGGLTYQGTDTTLYQTALHEIGHALGLGDTSDPGSVMYSALDWNNAVLNSTDVAAIQHLYGTS
jgi:hypothetical protein